MRWAIAVFACAACTHAQQAPVVRIWADTVSIGFAEYPAPPFGPVLLTGAPFSGEEALGDGRSANQIRTRMYRDAAGRTRMERSVAPVPPGAPNAPGTRFLVEINDPGAGVLLVLNDEKKIAHRVIYPPSSPNGNALPGGVRVSGRLIAPGTNVPVLPKPEPTVEQLGTKTIQGVTAIGTRSTLTLTDGEIVLEEWRSPVLQIVLRSVNRDPRGGERVTEVTNLRRDEPGSRLFQVPAGYRVVDARPPFRVEFGKR